MLDLERIAKNLQDIHRETNEIEEILNKRTIEEISKDSLALKALKYSIITINEAITNTLQHILAKHFAISISGYTECLEKALTYHIIPKELFQNLLLFVRFRNMIVHRYWIIDDKIFLKNLKSGLKDFKKFQLEIKSWLKKFNYISQEN